MRSAATESFLTAILHVLPKQPGILVMHSSLPDLMPPEDFFPAGALEVLNEVAKAGWTIALPAFTFTFCRNGIYDARTSRSETGLMADALLRHASAIRTPHPIYSFAVCGPRAKDIAACQSSTTFGDDSPFGLYERENATVVMMGCSWAFNTQIHRYEELAAVPYRYPKTFSGNADFGTGPGPAHATMWVRDLNANPTNDFSLAERNLRNAGLIRSAPLWRETIEAAAVSDIARICRADIAANPFAYVANAESVARALGIRAKTNAVESNIGGQLSNGQGHLLAE
jgi:aminoglycoside N3'-acetyltransferase